MILQVSNLISPAPLLVHAYTFVHGFALQLMHESSKDYRKLNYRNLKKQLLKAVHFSPLLQESTVVGRNVYGILRAGRSLGTESIILSVPLLEEGGHNRHGIAVMLALAEYFQSEM